MTRAGIFASASALCLGLLLSIGAGSQAQAAAKCIKGDRKPPYTIGWANIYSVPTWMKQTQGTIEAEVEELKKKGLVDKLVVTDAQGDANTQIQQIQSMIDSDVDAIILIAGSSSAPARVRGRRLRQGHRHHQFRQPRRHRRRHRQGQHRLRPVGRAGREVSDRRDGRQGQDPGAQRPGRHLGQRRPPQGRRSPCSTPTRTTSRSSPRRTRAYNVAPAQEAVTSLLFANPEIDGILSLGGALSAGAVLALDKQGREQVPITGENARQFLELWKEKGLKSLGDHAAELARRALRPTSPCRRSKARTSRPSSRSRCRSSTTPTSTNIWPAPRISRLTATSIRPTIRRLFDKLLAEQ